MPPLNCVRLEQVANGLREERSSIVVAAKRYRPLAFVRCLELAPNAISRSRNNFVGFERLSRHRLAADHMYRRLDCQTSYTIREELQ